MKPDKVYLGTTEGGFKQRLNYHKNSSNNSTYGNVIFNKEDYRPVSPLPILLKVFEKIIYKQMNSYMKDKLTKC